METQTRPVIHNLLVSNSEEEELVALCFSDLCLYADMFFFCFWSRWHHGWLPVFLGQFGTCCRTHVNQHSSLVVNTGKLIEPHFTSKQLLFHHWDVCVNETGRTVCSCWVDASVLLLYWLWYPTIKGPVIALELNGDGVVEACKSIASDVFSGTKVMALCLWHLFIFLNVFLHK